MWCFCFGISSVHAVASCMLRGYNRRIDKAWYDRMEQIINVPMYLKLL